MARLHPFLQILLLFAPLFLLVSSLLISVVGWDAALSNVLAAGVAGGTAGLLRNRFGT